MTEVVQALESSSTTKEISMARLITSSKFPNRGRLACYTIFANFRDVPMAKTLQAALSLMLLAICMGQHRTVVI
jgi:hypothetical protein